jgi:transcriptional regulator GlxA family with amidase domain
MPIRLGYLLIDGFALMSYAPVIEPFRAANSLSGRLHYCWRHYSVTGAPAQASNGIAVGVDAAVTAIDDLDILFVCAGGNPALFADPATLAALRRIARFGPKVAGVSGGPFVLARAGLLDGYRCTIHWEHEAAFLESFAAPRLERGLFVIDRDRITCAGGLAGLDLSAALIAQDHGAALARKVGDWYIQTEQRQGAGPQRPAIGQRYRISHAGLADALAAMDDTLAEPLPRASLASIAGVSVRQLERLFATQLGTTIAAHYLDLRLARAEKLLAETSMTVAETSAATGFANPSHFSREFKRRYATPPSSLRRAGRG